jgi:hypothetical protein
MENNKPAKKRNNWPELTPEVREKFIKDMYNYFLEDQNAVFVNEFFQKYPEYPYTYRHFMYITGTEGSARTEYLSKIKPLMETRLLKRALLGTYKENITKFILINNFGWKDKTESDLTVTTKPIVFKFGNPELNNKEENEENDEYNDYEDMTNQKQIEPHE